MKTWHVYQAKIVRENCLSFNVRLNTALGPLYIKGWLLDHNNRLMAPSYRAGQWFRPFMSFGPNIRAVIKRKAIEELRRLRERITNDSSSDSDSVPAGK